MRTSRTIACVLAVLGPLSGPVICHAQETAADAVAADAGQSILEKNCARCHAIGAAGDSTHKDAPPFRAVVTKYPPEALAEALAEGISPGHPDMPLFVFEPDEISAIIAYLETLRPASSP